jgi:hypothetical protein
MRPVCFVLTTYLSASFCRGARVSVCLCAYLCVCVPACVSVWVPICVSACVSVWVRACVGRETIGLGGGRDIFNEKPTREEMAVATTATEKHALGSMAVLHTTMGDITVCVRVRERDRESGCASFSLYVCMCV